MEHATLFMLLETRVLVWALLSFGFHGRDVWLSHSLSHRASQGSCRTGTGRDYIPCLLLHIYDWRKLLGRSECWFQEDSWRLRVRMINFICSRCQVSSTIVRDRDSMRVGSSRKIFPFNSTTTSNKSEECLSFSSHQAGGLLPALPHYSPR